MIYAALLILVCVMNIFCSDTEHKLTDSDQQIVNAMRTLARHASGGFELFAAGTTVRSGSFALYRAQKEKHMYEVKMCFDRKLHDVPVEEVKVKMNQPPCRCLTCNTVQLKLALEKVTYLCFSDDTEPTMSVCDDVPHILSIHEPIQPKRSAQASIQAYVVD